MDANEYKRMVHLKQRIQRKEKVSDEDFRDFERLLVLYFKNVLEEQWRII
jgi:hypothetical protein